MEKRVHLRVFPISAVNPLTDFPDTDEDTLLLQNPGKHAYERRLPGAIPDKTQIKKQTTCPGMPGSAPGMARESS
jgi:hypothetical protein